MFNNLSSVPRDIWINWLILATLGLIWGGSFLGVELALTGFGPINVAAGRVATAALTLLVIAVIFGDGLPGFANAIERRIWLHCLGMGLFTNAIPFCLLSWGQKTVTSGFAGISMAVVPLLVLPLSHFLVPGETLSRMKVIGFLFGFLGVVLLIGGDKIIGANAAMSPVMFTAQLACITASCCYAIGSIITRLCPPVSALSYAAAGLVLGGVILVPIALFFEGVPDIPESTALAGITYLALFPTAIATILLTILIRRAGPPFLSLVNYQVPVWAVVIGAVVLGEALPGHFLVALGIILGGLFISQFKRRRAIITETIPTSPDK